MDTPEHEPYRRPAIPAPPVADDVVRSVATGLPVLPQGAGDAAAVMQAATDILEAEGPDGEGEGDGLHLELHDDPGWWRVKWPAPDLPKGRSAVTFFRSRDEAVVLQEALRGTAAYVEWVQELP